MREPPFLDACHHLSVFCLVKTLHICFVSRRKRKNRPYVSTNFIYESACIVNFYMLILTCIKNRHVYSEYNLWG
jgi:hypothetical protein